MLLKKEAYVEGLGLSLTPELSITRLEQRTNTHSMMKLYLDYN